MSALPLNFVVTAVAYLDVFATFTVDALTANFHYT